MLLGSEPCILARRVPPRALFEWVPKTSAPMEDSKLELNPAGGISAALSSDDPLATALRDLTTEHSEKEK